MFRMRFSLGISLLSRGQTCMRAQAGTRAQIVQPCYLSRRFDSTSTEVTEKPKLRKTYKIMRQVNQADNVLAERQFMHMRVRKPLRVFRPETLVISVSICIFLATNSYSTFAMDLARRVEEEIGLAEYYSVRHGLYLSSRHDQLFARFILRWTRNGRKWQPRTWRQSPARL